MSYMVIEVKQFHQSATPGWEVVARVEIEEPSGRRLFYYGHGTTLESATNNALRAHR